ncbi:DUF4232 domain-containing protein [Arthrobacter sp. ISL-30]|uniref:DUF4232 domain-containing protein n=1 Tax=Arthrobacter sp. ISL-30 TaxID=2819109 RepID=UPI001BEC062B|nr:DUF4232 domain-containing protein [Arthrobacter sp. ISL-30]MBT2514875.1 DUF4232 domain-containing protein [Arthrobacter sp. ISL-30]
MVLASFAAGVLWSLGSILADWPPSRLAAILNGVDQSIPSSAYWGIVWGRVPAMAGVLAMRLKTGTKPPSRRPRAFWLGLVAACAALLVISVPLTDEAARAARAPGAAPAPSPSVPPVVYGSPNISPGQQEAGPGWCRGEQVTVTVGEPDAATGHRGLGLGLVNSGDTPCILESYPDIAFNNSEGWAMDVLLVHGGSFMTTDHGAKRLTLAPGASAQASLGWNAMAAAGETRVGTVLVPPYAGTLGTACQSTWTSSTAGPLPSVPGGTDESLPDPQSEADTSGRGGP